MPVMMQLSRKTIIMMILATEIFISESFNPPTNAGSFRAHLEKGDELPMGLTQDIALLGESAASVAESSPAPV